MSVQDVLANRRQWHIECGDALAVLRRIEEGTVHCAITSPPYYGLRSYLVSEKFATQNEALVWTAATTEQFNHEQNADGEIRWLNKGARLDKDKEVWIGEITSERLWPDGTWASLGLETTPAEFVRHLVLVFEEVRRVLRDDATLWVNCGDSYSAGGHGGHSQRSETFNGHAPRDGDRVPKKAPPGYKAKDLLGMPWALAFALRDAGWYLRAECIWAKCLSGGNWVYARTQKGDMPVMVKDLVRLNPSTVKLWNGQRWTQVVAWRRNLLPENRLELVLRSGERIGCTGDHVWPTQRGNVEARDLCASDVIKTCTLPDPGKLNPPYLNDDMLWLIGLYLAEGCSDGDRKIQIAGHADEAHWLGRVLQVARHYGGSATRWISGNRMVIRVYGRVLNTIIKEYVGGCSAHDKHLKVATWQLSNRALRIIAEAYLEGDGHRDPHNARYRLGFCRNDSLARDLRTLAARLGARLTLKPATATSQWGKYPCYRGEWRWNASGHGNERERGEVMEVRASRARQFWDIAVEDDPHLFALASGVLTHNCSPMPESVRDRPTRAHEQVFLLAKEPRYYYDQEAERVPAQQWGSRDRANGKYHNEGTGLAPHKGLEADTNPAGRNLWTWWTDISPEPYPAAHFATFPPDLPARCLRLGTSERGVCPQCGAPWQRVVERGESYYRRLGKTGRDIVPNDQKAPGSGGQTRLANGTVPSFRAAPILNQSWQPTCTCPGNAPPIPALVLDPFAGAGTTLLAAVWGGRRALGIELNPEYAEMARRRVANRGEVKPAKADDDAPLFAEEP